MHAVSNDMVRREYSKAVSKLETALVQIRASEHVTDSTREDLATILWLKGACLVELEDWPLALEALDETYEIFEHLVENNGRPLASEWANMTETRANCFSEMSMHAEALSDYTTALSLFDRARPFEKYGLNDASSEALGNRASTLIDLKQPEQAEKDLLRVLEYERKKGVTTVHNHLDFASTLNSYGNCLGGLGRTDEALAVFDEALETLDAIQDIQNSLPEADEAERVRLRALVTINRGAHLQVSHRWAEAFDGMHLGISKLQRCFDKLTLLERKALARSYVNQIPSTFAVSATTPSGIRLLIIRYLADFGLLLQETRFWPLMWLSRRVYALILLVARSAPKFNPHEFASTCSRYLIPNPAD